MIGTFPLRRGSVINLKVYFYQESNPNLNHTATITVIMGDLKETPAIDVNSFKISLFHWLGSFYFGEYYYWYEPSGLNPYYNFKIF